MSASSKVNNMIKKAHFDNDDDDDSKTKLGSFENAPYCDNIKNIDGILSAITTTFNKIYVQSSSPVFKVFYLKLKLERISPKPLSGLT